MPPIPLLIVGALLLLLLILLLLYVHLTISVNEDVLLELRVLFLRFRLYPERKKIKKRNYTPKALRRAARKKRRKLEKKRKKQEKQKKEQATANETKSKALRRKLRFVRAITAALIRRTRKYLKLRAARIHIRVATGDAATTAVAYGAVCQSLSYLLAALGQITHRVKAASPNVSVQADFLGEKSVLDIKLVFSMRVYGILATLCGVALCYVKQKWGHLFAPRKNKAKSKKGT